MGVSFCFQHLPCFEMSLKLLGGIWFFFGIYSMGNILTIILYDYIIRDNFYFRTVSHEQKIII